MPITSGTNYDGSSVAMFSRSATLPTCSARNAMETALNETKFAPQCAGASAATPSAVNKIKRAFLRFFFGGP
jgi:hypothetical protein